MTENKNDPEYLAWLSELKEGDEVAMVGKFGLETGEVRSVRKAATMQGETTPLLAMLIMVDSKTRGSCVYSFYDDDGWNEYHGIQLVPLTEERKEQAERDKQHNLKAARISTVNWQLQPDSTLDLIIGFMEEHTDL